MPNLPEGGARERASDSIDSEWLEHAFSRPCVDNSGSRRNSESYVGTSIPVTVPVNNGNGGFANVPDAMAIPQKYKPDVNSLGKAVKDGNERHNGSDIKSRIEESDSPIATALPLTTEKTIKADSENPTARRAQAFTNSEYIDRRLNILVAGASGLGKTTLLRAVVHALCRQYGCMDQWDKFLRRNGEEVVKTTSQKPQEKARLVFPWSNDTQLIVTIIDSRGFGDQLDERKSFEPIQQYIKQMYESYSQKYDTGRVTPLEDDRVHCCLYFLQPTRFRENDKTHMKALEGFCPIVPVIAKADTLGIDEINEFLLRGYCNCTPEQVKKIKLHGESNLPMDDAIVGDSNMAKAECLNTSETESPALGVLASIQKTKIEIFRLESNASPCFKIKCLEGPRL